MKTPALFALTAALVVVGAPAQAKTPVMRAVPGSRVVTAGQQFSIAIKVRNLRGPSSRKVCLFTKTGGRWRRLNACERVSVGYTFKLRVRLGNAAIGRNRYVVGAASANSGRRKPPGVRSNKFRLRVLPAT